MEEASNVAVNRKLVVQKRLSEVRARQTLNVHRSLPVLVDGDGVGIARTQTVIRNFQAHRLREILHRAAPERQCGADVVLRQYFRRWVFGVDRRGVEHPASVVREMQVRRPALDRDDLVDLENRTTEEVLARTWAMDVRFNPDTNAIWALRGDPVISAAARLLPAGGPDALQRLRERHADDGLLVNHHEDVARTDAGLHQLHLISIVAVSVHPGELHRGIRAPSDSIDARRKTHGVELRSELDKLVPLAFDNCPIEHPTAFVQELEIATPSAFDNRLRLEDLAEPQIIARAVRSDAVVLPDADAKLEDDAEQSTIARCPCRGSVILIHDVENIVFDADDLRVSRPFYVGASWRPSRPSAEARFARGETGASRGSHAAATRVGTASPSLETPTPDGWTRKHHRGRRQRRGGAWPQRRGRQRWRICWHDRRPADAGVRPKTSAR
mmetsp:Transcript_88129/g.247885  ORF Transcript_88129/g.247885 Transcript_88129/m.247885 type:complete len:442 (-) Transcript_88129:107-1432(-)